MSMGGGSKPKTPTMVQQATRIEQSDTNLQKENIMKELAKKKRATLYAQNLGQANVKTQTLGAGV